jgi:hypothetical protein
VPITEPASSESRISSIGRGTNVPDLDGLPEAVALAPTAPAPSVAAAVARIEPAPTDEARIHVTADRLEGSATVRTEVRTIWSELPSPSPLTGKPESPVPDRPTPPRLVAPSPAISVTPVGEMPAQEPRKDEVADRIAWSREKTDSTPTEASTVGSGPVRTVEVVREETQFVDRDVVVPSETLREIETVELLPSPSQRAQSIHSSEPTPERFVHVRIGTIEIHSTEPERHAVPVAPPAQEARRPVDFDSFARLRRYAPWQW